MKKIAALLAIMVTIGPWGPTSSNEIDQTISINDFFKFAEKTAKEIRITLEKGEEIEESKKLIDTDLINKKDD